MKIQATEEERALLKRMIRDFVDDTKSDVFGWGIDEQDRRDIELGERMLADVCQQPPADLEPAFPGLLSHDD